MRIAMYVDALSLWNGATGYANQLRLAVQAKVDYQRLKKTVQGDRELSVARAYVLDKGKAPMGEFVTRLQSLGYEVRHASVASWAVFREQMETDIDADADRVDTIALVTQDIPAWSRFAEELQQDGLRVEFWSFDPQPMTGVPPNVACHRLDQAVFR